MYPRRVYACGCRPKEDSVRGRYIIAVLNIGIAASGIARAQLPDARKERRAPVLSPARNRCDHGVRNRRRLQQNDNE